MTTTALPARLPRRAAENVKERVERVVGGPARARVVTLLGCVLALESADLATIGATAPELEHALHVSNAQVGLLAAIASFVGALATLPIGALTDRVRRVNLLAGSIVLWGAAMIAGAAAHDYTWLLLTRLALGVVTATVGPTLASLTGDFFPAAERAKIYGYILSGELVGAGVGFVVSGSIAGLLSWRWAFGLLAVPAAVLAYVIWRHLPEPRRGGQRTLEPENANGRRRGEVATRAVLEQEIEPSDERVLTRDPLRLRLREAIRYVLAIPTNRWLIVASAVGYFFFAGMRTFALVFVRGHFGLGQAGATAVLFVTGLGSLVGVLTAGRIADRLIARGRLNARIIVGSVAYLVAAAVLLPGLLATSLIAAAPLFFIGGVALSAPNPPLDAARLDVMPARLWGRAEGVRTLLRQTAMAGAPLLFGFVADALGGGQGTFASGGVSASETHALQSTFLIMLVPLALNGALLLGARRSYPTDVATAIASERRGATS